MDIPGQNRPELKVIHGDGEAPRQGETLLQYARRLVKEAFNAPERQPYGAHLEAVPASPSEPEPESAPPSPVYPGNVRPIESAPGYQAARGAENASGSGALAPVAPLTTAEGELMTEQQRRVQDARHKVEIAHSMGPSTPEAGEEEPPIA